MHDTLQSLVEDCKKKKMDLVDLIILDEMTLTEKTREYVISRAKKHLSVMFESIEKAKKDTIELAIPELSEQSEKMNSAPFFLSNDLKEAVYWSMAVAEYNSNMGLICAAPTAGSVGIFPAALLKAKQQLKKTDEDVLEAFFVGAAIGRIIGNNASLSGSEAGCQAEVGTAAAMAASAMVYLAGGTIEKIVESVGLVLINLLGLVCDPVAGLVLTPCIKRNAMGVVNAFLGAEMALSGVKSVIPPDEIVKAMGDVGRKLPHELRETGLGGIAGSKTARNISDRLKKESQDI